MWERILLSEHSARSGETGNLTFESECVFEMCNRLMGRI
jgi:hypothetical protein